MSRAFPLAAVFLVLSCRKAPADPAGPGDGAAASTSADDAGPPGTPVKIARVVRATLLLTVSGPGRTDALVQQKVRAPFKGLLRELRVSDGDLVKKGHIVAVLVSQESESALTGARALLRSATTPQQKDDAQRALQLAQRGLVATSLRAPADGVVVAHGADEGSLVAEAQDIVSLAATDSFVFVASIAQTEISQLRPGQPAQVILPAHPGPIAGKVHSILPAASPNDLNEPTRIDLAQAPHALGLFGTATITVGERRDVPVLPEAAVLRDDVTGVNRVAFDEGGKLKWQTVRTGASAGGKVEIVDPPLPDGTQVVTDGQVGLPDGAPLQVVP